MIAAWSADGLAIVGRRVREVDCVSGLVRARIRASRVRVVVDLTAAGPQQLALAVAHRLAAHVLEQVAAADGWLLAEPIVRGATVIVSGAHAAEAIGPFFGGAADAALRTRARRRRLASGTSPTSSSAAVTAAPTTGATP